MGISVPLVTQLYRLLISTDLLEKVNPDQIYVAGDLSDPHGTHRVCAQAILEALDVVRGQQIDPEVWLYRGAWQEFEPHEIERAVPLSPEVALRKKMAIFKHESQKDSALFPGFDSREFWQRAEQRNRDTAKIYDKLGLAEYEAIEAFVLWDGIAQDSAITTHSQEATSLKPAGSQVRH